MNKTKLLIWVIIILIVINLATIISGFVYSSRTKRAELDKTEVPFNQRANFLQATTWAYCRTEKQFYGFRQGIQSESQSHYQQNEFAKA